MSPKPSEPQSRSKGLGTLLALVVVGGILAAILAPEAVQALLPGAGSLVALAWSAASPNAAGQQAAAGRLSSAEAQALADRAEEAWQSGHWAEVAESLTALAAAGPRDRRQDDLLYEAHINLGWAELGKGRPEEAQSHLARALEVRPGGQEALEGLRLARQPVAEASSAALASAPPSSPSQAAASSESICHIVQPGDTLFALARRFGTTVEAIKAANGLPCSKIVVGQKLLIPVCVQPKPPVCEPVCPTPAPPVVCVPVCPTPAPKVVCAPVCPPVVCAPVCPPVVCAPVCPPVVCAPVCPTPVCVPLCDP